MLELWTHEDAFGRLEAYLAEAGFFGGGAEGVVADVFLGYGLSQGIRRRPEPPPPEPCRLPLLACRIRPEDAQVRSARDFSIGEWEQSWTDAEYAAAIEAVRAAIARGDV